MPSEFEIVTLKTGIKSLRSIERGETFHPVTGPRGEATLLHVEQQRIVARSAELSRFVIWDVGLGAAANALTAIEALQDSPAEIEIHSFDRTLSALSFALEHSDDLDYVRGYETALKDLAQGLEVRIAPRIRWKLHLGDFRDKLREGVAPTPHSIFYDPYSPSENPDMWNLEHFKNLRQSLSADAPCILSNYTRSTAVRVSLLLSGFCVGVGCSIGEKAETTLASNEPSLIEHPLDRAWLERVKRSRNSAPLRSEAYGQGPISSEDFEALLLAPQFA
jgi:tRNA U34 5-methylaminomethyl-2-thiouridine-forming methyltransferase MnmC